jgi:hypothetical protein
VSRTGSASLAVAIIARALLCCALTINGDARYDCLVLVIGTFVPCLTRRTIEPVFARATGTLGAAICGASRTLPANAVVTCAHLCCALAVLAIAWREGFVFCTRTRVPRITGRVIQIEITRAADALCRVVYIACRSRCRRAMITSALLCFTFTVLTCVWLHGLVLCVGALVPGLTSVITIQPEAVRATGTLGGVVLVTGRTRSTRTVFTRTLAQRALAVARCRRRFAGVLVRPAGLMRVAQTWEGLRWWLFHVLIFSARVDVIAFAVLRSARCLRLVLDPDRRTSVPCIAKGSVEPKPIIAACAFMITMRSAWGAFARRTVGARALLHLTHAVLCDTGGNRLVLSVCARVPSIAGTRVKPVALIAARAFEVVVVSACCTASAGTIGALALLGCAHAVLKIVGLHGLVLGVSTLIPTFASKAVQEVLATATGTFRVVVLGAEHTGMPSAVCTSALLRVALAVIRACGRHCLVL